MPGEELKRRIKSLCPEVKDQAVDDFWARMDEDYFATVSPGDIATHIRMSVELSAKQRVAVRITPRPSDARQFDIVIVGYDYPSEFSVFCGLLSAFGLDIREGDVYSFDKSGVARSSRRKIVDIFRVELKQGEVFDAARQLAFEQELQALAELLATGSTEEARGRLNRFLIEQIEKMNEPLSGLVHPIQVHFDNDLSPEWTVMEARSEDAFALLYAISNALAMQGINIHKVNVRCAVRQAQDRFFLADRWGRKIQDVAQQERLRTAVAIIKQFTRFLPEAPDPAKAMRHFDQFLDKMADESTPDRLLALLAGSEGMNLLAHLLGSSDYLWDDFLRIHFTDLLPLLERLAGRDVPPEGSKRNAFSSELSARLREAATFEDKKRVLNRFKDDQVFFADAQHLRDPSATLGGFSQDLTDLAELVLDEAVRICAETVSSPLPGLFTICGLGKFGGREMGSASDIELMFIHEEQGTTRSPVFESLARRVFEIIETRNKGIFQIDLRLRPYGDHGAWSVPFAEFQRYYSPSGSAAAFERQALIKLRWVAADPELGRRVEAHRDQFTYSDAPWDRENALHLRQRQMRELVKPGRTNVKYSAGGLIDIEYAVQYLQLLHGNRYRELRLPNTLEALQELQRLRLVSESEYEVLHPSYLFLRNLIDALRIVRGDSSDLLLPEETSEEFKSLARRLGYREPERAQAAGRLRVDIQQRMDAVHAFFKARFARPS